MRRLNLVSTALILLALPLDAQQGEDELRAVIRRAEGEPTPLTLAAAANAARLLRDFDAAGRLYASAWDAQLRLLNQTISDILLHELASGGGVNGLQRRFREIRNTINLTPQMIVSHVSTYPSLLRGGEFDELVLSLSREHPDPGLRCTCYHAKAWVHRVAGRPDVARAYFDSLTVEQERSTPPGNPDAEAEWRAQLARDLARAGRTEDARRLLEEAMAMPVSDEWMPRVRRRWAQVYAELGDAAAAVEHLEQLLAIPSLVTVHTLETRMAWDPIRDRPEFRALLERHRGGGR